MFLEIEDEIDHERIWNSICEMAARYSGVTATEARVILDSAGFNAHGHGGVVEAVQVVQRACGLRVLRPV